MEQTLYKELIVRWAVSDYCSPTTVCIIYVVIMMTSIEICSQSLILLGADEIITFQDETRESKLCNIIYELTVRSCLADRNWTFAQNQVQLNKLSQTPLFGYSAAFQLPSDYIRLCGKENPGLPHQIKENYLFCNANEVKVNYIFRASEEKFPPHFTEYLIATLCKKLAISLMEDEQKSAYYDRQAADWRKKAGYNDSSSNGNTIVPFHNFALIAVRV